MWIWYFVSEWILRAEQTCFSLPAFYLSGKWPRKTVMFTEIELLHENAMTDCKTKFVISLVGQAHCLTITTALPYGFLRPVLRAFQILGLWLVSWQSYQNIALEHLQARNITSTRSTMNPFARSHKLAKNSKSAKLVRTRENVFPGRDVSRLCLQPKSTANVISSVRGR